ncbi:hypothetical protein [Sorangium sp. So ce854]|uniref:hypothetical protein n=1 Tax=Sorangium sp. So ce854 TaxID=3133322 RepID=UPI003F643199
MRRAGAPRPRRTGLDDHRSDVGGVPALVDDSAQHVADRGNDHVCRRRVDEARIGLTSSRHGVGA